MVHITLKEWSSLTDEERKAWLDSKSMLTLTELLQMLEEMSVITNDIDHELATLDEPNDSILSARKFTFDTLLEVKNYVVSNIQQRSAQLISRTV